MLSIKINEIRLIAKVALPLVTAFLAQKGMQLIDTIMMGWIGAQALAAGALGTSIFMLILVFSRGTLSAVGIFIAHARGANTISDIKLHFQRGLLLAVILSIPSMLIIWFTPYILPMFGEDPGVIVDTKLLIHGLVWGFPGMLFFLVFRELIAAFSLARFVMIVSIASLPLTFIANYILIYGKFGMPKLGIAGIGYAGSIIMYFMFCCLWVYSKKHKLLRGHISLKISSQDLRYISNMFYVGAPSGLIVVLDVGLFLVAALLIGYFGVIALAAYQIALQCASVVYNIPLALSLATSLQVGHAVGSKNIDQAKKYITASLGIGLLISAIIALFLITIPEVFVKIFISVNEPNYQKIVQIASGFLALTALLQCFDTIQTIMNGALRGFNDTFVPLILSIPCYWLIGVGSAYCLAFHTNLAAMGVWYGLILGISSAALVLIFRLRQLLKIKKQKYFLLQRSI